MKNIYVGNFAFSTTEAQLREVFDHYGAIQNVNVIRNEYTGKPRGFAFIEMTNDTEGDAAITALNGSQMEGRALVVNEARPKTERVQRGGGLKRSGGSFGGDRG
jgi:cold-inducible RNA-binding protein